MAVNFSLHYIDGKCPTYGPNNKIASWFGASAGNWAGDKYWECYFRNDGTEPGVLNSLSFFMCSCNSGNQSFAIYSSGPPYTLAKANGTGFKVRCLVSTDGKNYDYYGSEEFTLNPTGPNAESISTASYTGTWFRPFSNIIFNFKGVPAVSKGGSIYVRIEITGTIANTTHYEGSAFISTKQKNEVIIPDFKPPEDPDPAGISFVEGSEQWITDKNIINKTSNIKKNYECKFTIRTIPENSTIKSFSISRVAGTPNLVTASVSGSVITCRAQYSDTDYSSSETLKLTVNGGASANFKVNFCNKPTSVVSLNQKALNIRTASNYSFTRTDPNDDFQISEGIIWLTSNTTNDELVLSKKTFTSKTSTMNIADHVTNNLRFLSIRSNSENIFKINRENVPSKIKFKVFNTVVQDNVPENVYASCQTIKDVTWSISPNDVKQISYDWVYGTDNKVIAKVNAAGATTSNVVFSPGYSSLPETAVIGLSGNVFPMIGNLRYENNDKITDAGYCRGMRVEYMTSKSEPENSVINAGRVYYYDKTSEPNVTPTTVSGRINPVQSILTELSKLKEFYIRITPYFYFGSARTSGTTVSDTSSASEDTRRYFGNSFTVPQKFIYVKESDFYTPFLFPTVKSSQPYTPMMLPQVERSGHFLNKAILDVRDLANRMDFGIKIGTQKEISVRKNPEYFSSTALQTHMVANIGQAVIDFSETDSSVLSASLEIQPFIDIYYDEKYYVRISTNSSVLVADTGITGNTNMTLPTVIHLDTRKSSMWNPRVKDPAEGERPAVHKGELIFYHDYDNFQAFVNKYQNLIPNRLTNQTSFTVKPVPVSKTTEMINTEFWIEIANRISKYAESMQNWATSVNQVSWAMSRFTIHKGTVIDNINPLASLFQNYWDLLVKCSSLDSFATHKYLHDMGYTHKMLSSFTHTQIMNKEGI